MTSADQLTTFVIRMARIGIKIEMSGNYPWIYLEKVNDCRVAERYHSKHGFTIAFSPIRRGQQLKFTNIGEIFKVIRKYK